MFKYASSAFVKQFRELHKNKPSVLSGSSMYLNVALTLSCIAIDFIVLLILVIISLIIILGGKSNKKDNTIIQGDSGNVYGNTEYVARLFQQTMGADL